MSTTEPEKQPPPSPSASTTEDNADAQLTATTEPASEEKEKKKGRYDAAEVEKGPQRTLITFFANILSLNLAQMRTLICHR